MDRVPPMVVSTRPDTFAVVEPFDDPVVIRFHERISERPSTGQLKDAIVVSPETGEVSVGKKGDRLEIRLRGGFQGGYVYRVTVLPVIRDLFQNGMRDPFEFVFSTGPDGFDATVLAGLVRDSITGGPLEGSRVEVVLAPSAEAASDTARAAEGDTLLPEGDPQEGPDGWAEAVRYVARADSGGAYALRYAPEGRLRLRAFQDRNRNGQPDYAEPQAETAVTLSAGDTLLESLSLLPLDTTPPVLARAEALDSTTVRLIFDDFLRPDDRLETVQVNLTLDEARGPRVSRLLNQVQAARIYQARADSAARADSLRADSLARADSIAREEAARADSVAAADTVPPDTVVTDTVPPDTLVAEPPEEAVPVTDTLFAEVGGGPLQDTLGVLLGEGRGRGGEPERPPPPVIPEGLDRPERPGQSFFAYLREPLLLDTTYQVQVSGVRNIQGTPGGEGTTELRMESPPVDSAAVEDSLAVDTAATGDSVAVDTLWGRDTAAGGDTMFQEAGAASDTVPPDTTTRADTVPGEIRVPGDTVPADTTAPADTLPPDTASVARAGGTGSELTPAGTGIPAGRGRPVAALGDLLARGFQWIRGRALGLTTMPAVTRVRR